MAAVLAVVVASAGWMAVAVLVEVQMAGVVVVVS